MSHRRAPLALLLLAACAVTDPPKRPPAAPLSSASAPAPAPTATSAPVPETPESRARAFVEAVAQQRYDAATALLDDEMASAAAAGELTAFWHRLEEAGGPFKGIDGAESTVESDLRVVRVTARFAHLRKVLRFVFDEDDRIGGLLFGPVHRDLADAAREVVDKLASGDYRAASAGFDAVMKGSLPPDKLEDVWKKLVRKSGPFVAVNGVEITPNGAFWSALLTCRFGAGPLGVKVVYDIRDQVVGLFFLSGDSLAPWKPPIYAAEDRFTERDVSVGPSPSLPGTLSIPKGQGPFPVVVLVHGSGPMDADATLGPNKIFKDLAWGLASRGIAALRYEKRTLRAPAGVATVKEEVLDGARAAVELAQKTADLDAKRIVIAGHSQGGWLAPRIAAENPGVAAIVLLAGPSRPPQDSMIEQLSYFLKLDPGSDEKKRLVAAAKAFKARVEDPALRAGESVDIPGGGAEKATYFLSLRGYSATDAAARLSIPILVLQGDRDYQVTTADFDGWKRAIGASATVRLKRYPALNHLFIAGTGTPRPNEYEAPGHVDSAVLGDIAAFVGKLPAGAGKQ